ncbi:uncharacterized protein LOC62_06G008396 [Vanrija pseudolonga]|uniref:Uncharacterized protein n=1 Tax=Vanrija pseudolonga TaxID=143232 RepID=A0AAF1BNY9_9TREE|nr:hypothetical protein LOC62_06G008396 [Vanrija pseudolonga]
MSSSHTLHSDEEEFMLFIDSHAYMDETMAEECLELRIAINEFWTFYRRINTHLPNNMWEIPHSTDLANAIEAYFNTRLQYGPEEKASTVRRWALCVLCLAEYHILGGDPETNGVRAAFDGVTPSGEDSLGQLIVKQVVPIIIRRHRLPDRPERLEFYGPSEATLVVRHLESEVLANPKDAVELLQMKALNQLCLSVGPRTCSLLESSYAFMRCGNTRKFLSHGCLTIHQDPRNYYTVEVNVEHLKLYDGTVDTSVNFSPRIPPVTKPGNLLLEFASSLIPLAIHRKSLYTVRKGTKHFFHTLEDFRDATDKTFYLSEPHFPFFREVDEHGQLSNEALSYDTAAKHTEITALCINLPASKLKNYRTYVGDLADSVWGSKTQYLVINLGTPGDAGPASTSIADIPVAAAVLEEYDLLPKDTHEKIMCRLGMLHKNDSPAVSAVSRIHLGTKRRSAYTKMSDTGNRSALQRIHEFRQVGTIDEHNDSQTVVGCLREAPPFLVATGSHGYKTLDSEINALWPRGRPPTTDPLASFWPSSKPDDSADSIGAMRFEYMKKQLAYLQSADPR